MSHARMVALCAPCATDTKPPQIEHAGCGRYLRIFCEFSIRFLGAFAAKAKEMMQCQFGFRFGAAMAEEFFQILSLDQPRHFAAVRNQTLVLDPTDDCLTMSPNRLSCLPDRIDIVHFDPVRGWQTGHYIPSDGNGPDVFWQTCAASQASTSSSRYKTRAPILRNLGPFPSHRHCSSVLGERCHRCANCSCVILLMSPH